MSTTTQTSNPSNSTTNSVDTTPTTPPSGTTTGTLIFYAPPSDGSAPYQYAGDLQNNPPPGEPQKNYTEEPHSVRITDIRGRENDFDINTCGFGTLSGLPPSAEKEFTDDDSIKKNYYPEVEALLLENIPGAQRVHLFDHTVRRSNPDAPRAPVTRAHIDQTARSAEQRVRNHMPAGEAEELLQGRYRLINVWRPLNGPVVSSPLAFADSRSVPNEDVVAVAHRYPDRTGETAGVKYREAGEWFYWSGIGERERVLLQCFDSRDGARTPHSAFVDPRTQEGWKGRESIEVRALVFG